MIFDGFCKSPPKAAGTVIFKEHAITVVFGIAPGLQTEWNDFIPESAGIPVCGRRTLEIADHINLSKRFVKRCPEDVTCGRVAQKTQIVLKPLVGDLAPGIVG